MSTQTLKDLYERKLGELYLAEADSVQLLSILGKGAYAPELSAALAKVASRARVHATRLGQMLAGAQGDSPSSQSTVRFFVRCMELSREELASEVRDAALIATCQHFLHDLIAGYGSAREWAKVLGDGNAHASLQLFLTDEKVLDGSLCRIAESLNRRAAQCLVVA